MSNRTRRVTPVDLLVLDCLHRGVRPPLPGIDREVLARRVLAGHALDPDERAFIAGLLRGDKRPRHRPASAMKALRDQEIAGAVMVCKILFPGPIEAIVARVAEDFAVSRRTVYAALKSFPPDC